VSAWTNSDGQVSGFPYSSFVWPIWYNQALFDQAGVDIPTTYDDLVTASAALRAAGIQPFAIAGGDWPGNNFLTWIAQQYLDAEGSAALAANGDFCSPDALKGLELLSEMTRNGVFIDDAAGYTADTMTSAYFNGDAAMMPSGSWAISGAPDDIIENTVLGGFPVPDGGAYDKPTMFFGDTSTGIWISRNGQENLDAARKFVEFMYQPETVNAFIDGADMIPSAVVSSDSPVPANPLLAKAVTLRDANDGIVLWDTLTPVGVDSQAVANSIYGGTPASEACASLETIWADAKG
jgi:multiple sugar transport system substrate-binding protein